MEQPIWYRFKVAAWHGRAVFQQPFAVFQREANKFEAVFADGTTILDIKEFDDKFVEEKLEFNNIVQGMLLTAKDDCGYWVPAKVMSISTHDSTQQHLSGFLPERQNSLVHVHFLGWSKKHDFSVALDDLKLMRRYDGQDIPYDCR